MVVHAVDAELQDEIAGEIIATNVSLEEYMGRYAARRCEWVEGMVIQVSPTTIRHFDLIAYLLTLLRAYFELRPIGRVVGEPIVMRLPEFPNRRREPNLMVILKSNTHELKESYLDGPADVCIEVVSEESTARDRGEKFVEYEKGGVPEYWILGPVRQETLFSRLEEVISRGAPAKR